MVMEITGNTILITGGATGIGLTFAERFLKSGNTVIVCGRRNDALLSAQGKFPELKTRVCDVSDVKERESLVQWAVSEFPRVNVLINNAGIQRRVRVTEKIQWEETAKEIAINLSAPIHLASLFIPHLTHSKNPAIINVTSGLAFVPIAGVPVYCATKAALHSYTLSLRHQLSETPIRVIEIIPPAVNTDLGGPGLHTFGVPANEFADAVFERLQKGDLEIAYGFAQQSSTASRAEIDQIFTQMNSATH